MKPRATVKPRAHMKPHANVKHGKQGTNQAKADLAANPAPVLDAHLASPRWAVVVMYHPDEETLQFWQRMAKAVNLVVVDNTPSDMAIKTPTWADYWIANHNNLGIAKALNQGLHMVTYLNDQALRTQCQWQNAKAVVNGAPVAPTSASAAIPPSAQPCPELTKSVTQPPLLAYTTHAPLWCALFDQDTRISVEQIEQLFAKAGQLSKECDQAKRPSIAALCPSYRAKNLDRFGDLITIDAQGISRLNPNMMTEQQKQQVYPVAYTITSGSVVNLAAMEKIGLHDDKLFIDFVDIEWGLRANHLGYQVLQWPQVVLEHQLGDAPIELFGHKIVTHSAVRHFYYFRNAMLLMKRGYVPAVWKRTELKKLLPRFVCYALFAKPRLKHTRAMLAGLWAGLQGQTGRQHQPKAMSKDIKR
ncbi:MULTISPECIES: hypothetical protein [unclassified Vibrio]|uniref:Rhamnosyltransferase n=1 Tax=Vibrio sp. HB236076 TaxID=3232307 RepID=A0AB39HFS6_9VIBR|nr:hypothetical protein [Vibrio sp. HB161653]MDP5254352.1 hypothetical protein [Vibrio sp. HB161653]